jgi:manganese efflux pump family protein
MPRGCALAVEPHTLGAMLALLLVAGSLGLSNFAASIAIGITGVDRQLRVRVALAFGLFEAGMPILGLLLGRRLSDTLGSRAHLIGGALLVATGLFTVGQALRTSDTSPSTLDLRRGRLWLLAASLSIDNLIVGFALGAYDVPVVLGVTIIAGVSVALSLVGLELGDRLGSRAEHDSEVLAGLVLICVGAAIAIGLR